jgi:hypothetical protein
MVRICIPLAMMASAIMCLSMVVIVTAETQKIHADVPYMSDLFEKADVDRDGQLSATEYVTARTV